MTVKMYLRDNYIHGDLHGGNLMYSLDPRDDRVIVLDAGLTTALERDWASPFGYLLHALSTGDADKVAEKLIQFNQGTTPVDNVAVRHDIRERMLEYMPEGGGGAGSVNMGSMIGEILCTLQKHGISLRGDVALTIVTMSISEGLIRQLDPEFDIVRRSLPYFVKFRSWRKASLEGKEWEGHHEGTANNGGLPLAGNRGVAVTAHKYVAQS